MRHSPLMGSPQIASSRWGASGAGAWDQGLGLGQGPWYKACFLCLISNLCSEATMELSRNSRHSPKVEEGKIFFVCVMYWGDID